MNRALQPRLRWITITLGLFACCAWASDQPRNQAISDLQVKAAYIYNFAKFVGWPEQGFASPTAPIRFCILSDVPFQTELQRIVNGKLIAGHPVELVSLDDSRQIRDCHVLFVGAAQAGRTQAILDDLRDASVLTVGEANDFIQQGGIINFVLQEDRVRFQVNAKAASRAKLYISSRLLEVAQRVFE